MLRKKFWHENLLDKKQQITVVLNQWPVQAILQMLLFVQCDWYYTCKLCRVCVDYFSIKEIKHHTEAQNVIPHLEKFHFKTPRGIL